MMRQITKIIVHHTAGATTATVAELRKLHLARGYSDIGYHWIIRKDGANDPWLIEKGRDEGLIGAHDAGENTGSIGIVVCGDYTKIQMSREAWGLLVILVAERCRHYGLTSYNVYGHRENEPATTQTQCPGFHPQLLRESVRARMEGVDSLAFAPPKLVSGG